MGLCKCPKRRVTNQFCFEHLVNVCEHCMVTNHPKCIVQSYLQWLQDSDYNPICFICSKELSGEICLRLTCYHVFHWSCLNKITQSIPPSAGPTDYVCPTCKTCLFPANNLVSPVADVLREKLSQVNWGRAGLGLPLLAEKSKNDSSQVVGSNGSSVVDSPSVNHFQQSSQYQYMPSSNSSSYNAPMNSNSSPAEGFVKKHSVVHVDDFQEPFLRNDFPLLGHAPRRVFQAIDDPKDLLIDHDENKYKRRSAIEWFLRWWNIVSGTQSRRRSGSHVYRRYVIIGMLLVIGLCLTIVVFSWFGKIATKDDPMFDEHQNPLVKNQS